MGILSSLAEVATGGLADKVVDLVKTYLPPDLTPEQKANIQLAAENMELQQKVQFAAAQSQAEKDLDDRIAMYEGTSSDLKAVPYLGAFMLLIRGAQRPVWGFGVLIIDYYIFSGAYDISKNSILSNAFWMINFLVLGFLFGERAVMNVMPFIKDLIVARNASIPSQTSVSTPTVQIKEIK